MQIVLGAGLAGLSLACALVREDVRQPIVVVDRRTAFGRDRTWCTWRVRRTPFLELARYRWAAWEVRTDAGAAPARCPAHPYVHIDSRDFYDAALSALDRAPQVELRLGERVLEIGDGWARTDRERLEGHVHDALALGSPALRGRARGDTELWQGFVGWEVEVDRPVFRPGVATLMDFRCAQDGAVQFVYVLPFSDRSGLVEHTSLAQRGPAPEQRRDAIAEHLHDRLGARAWDVRHEERGRILMTTATLPARRSPRTSAIGVAGGGVRASSGYAFTRVQTHATAVARAVAARRAPPARAGAVRRAALDAIFLRALAADPGAFPERFRTLVARLPAATFARFMTDQSTALDEARVIAALPPLPFARQALPTFIR